jgi:hypothetical protein
MKTKLLPFYRQNKCRTLIISALKKDLKILKAQKKATENYINIGCGHFLNIGNDQWCGGKKEVMKLLNDIIALGEKWMVTAANLKPNSDFIFDDTGEIRYYLPNSWAEESDRLVFGDKILGYPDCFPNFNKIIIKIDKQYNKILYQ